MNNTKRKRERERERERAKISRRCKTVISKGVQGFPRLINLQTSTDAIVRFTNITEDGDKLLEGEFMVHEKCYREYARLPEDETVRCLKFHIKNVNTKLYFFTISAYNNFLEFFRVKLI